MDSRIWEMTVTRLPFIVKTYQGRVPPVAGGTGGRGGWNFQPIFSVQTKQRGKTLVMKTSMSSTV